MDLKASVYSTTVSKFFAHLETEITSESDIKNPQHLQKLAGIFGNRLKYALDAIDRKKLKLYRAEDIKRELVEICENKDVVYKLFPNVNYCPCSEFRQQVASTDSSSYTCKHILAVKLLQICGKLKEEIIEDDVFLFLVEAII